MIPTYFCLEISVLKTPFFLSILEMTGSLRGENSSFEVYREFAIETDSFLREEFLSRRWCLLHSAATQLTWKSMGKGPVCLLLTVNLDLGRGPSVHTLSVPEVFLYQNHQKLAGHPLFVS